MAKAMVRATALGGIATACILSSIRFRASGFVMEPAKFVRTRLGEMPVAQSLSPGTWRTSPSCKRWGAK